MSFLYSRSSGIHGLQVQVGQNYNMTDTACSCMVCAKHCNIDVVCPIIFACFPCRRRTRCGLDARHLLNSELKHRHVRGVSRATARRQLVTAHCTEGMPLRRWPRPAVRPAFDRQLLHRIVRLKCWLSVSDDDDSGHRTASVVCRLCRHCSVSRLRRWQYVTPL